jgi:adenylosuccinate lyase
MDPINALTPLDGRYGKTIAPLCPFFSESAYIRHRIIVEVAWLKALSSHLPQLPPFSPSAIAHMDSIAANFTVAHAARCKELEAVTNHDVKAIEYTFPSCNS